MTQQLGLHDLRPHAASMVLGHGYGTACPLRSASHARRLLSFRRQCLS
ncbi:hypothetical protein [Onishia taeanensis]|nr:hypothetical protein [Halomonas taeanensis]